MLLEDVITTTTTDQTIFTLVDDTKTTEKQQITDIPGDGLDSLTTTTSILTATTVPETIFVRTTTDTTDLVDDTFGVGNTEGTTIVTAGKVDNIATTLEDIVTEEPTTRRSVVVTTTEEVVENADAVTEEFFDDDPEFNEVDNEGGKNIVCLN